MITIPALNDTYDIKDTDLVMVTTSEGQSYKMAGSELNKRHKVVISDNTTLTGAPLKNGNVVRVYFTADLTTSNGSTALVLSYNSVNYAVKIPKDGALVSYYAFDMGDSTFKYLQAYTTLELLYDGTQFVVIGNPVVLSGTGYTIYANSTRLGSAAGKTAGSAAGNVPLVGTALGTTNNNIVVTDTSGGLKPSGTAIGSAAGKTAGSAAGNVPLVGTALGTTNNNIVVTDTSGALKPSGTAIGSAAGKTAGSAQGNVPLVGTALGTTNNNIVVTDTSGGLKPSGTAIGSAAGKTAGSAAGNVPLVGTALGTTDKNIVVTDTAGKLKPSGTTIGSAAGKTAGSAAGNVPLVGTALGTTNNNIVVTDTSGALKPSGTAIGSAAGKTAGAAAGNVPLVGTALGTTNNNIVVTDTSGQLKPYGVSAPGMMTYGVYSSVTATMSGSGTSLKATIALTNLTGLTAAAGTVLKVTFSAALEHTAAIYSVELTFGGVTKAIKAARGGSLVNLASHQFTGGNYNSSKPHKVWDAYTTLELMYTGSEWVVMGDAVLCSYVSTSQNYTVKANGLIEQWGDKSYSSKTVSLYVTHSNTNYAIIVAGCYPSSTNAGMIIDSSSSAVTSSSFKVWATSYSNGGYYWKTSGY